MITFVVAVEIWHSDWHGYKVFKNNWQQVVTPLYTPQCVKFKMAAADNNKLQAVSFIYIKIMGNTILVMFFVLGWRIHFCCHFYVSRSFQGQISTLC